MLLGSEERCDELITHASALANGILVNHHLKTISLRDSMDITHSRECWWAIIFTMYQSFEHEESVQGKIRSAVRYHTYLVFLALLAPKLPHSVEVRWAEILMQQAQKNKTDANQRSDLACEEYLRRKKAAPELKDGSIFAAMAKMKDSQGKTRFGSVATLFRYKRERWPRLKSPT